MSRSSASRGSQTQYASQTGLLMVKVPQARIPPLTPSLILIPSRTRTTHKWRGTDTVLGDPFGSTSFILKLGQFQDFGQLQGRTALQGETKVGRRGMIDRIGIRCYGDGLAPDPDPQV